VLTVCRAQGGIAFGTKDYFKDFFTEQMDGKGKKPGPAAILLASMTSGVFCQVPRTTALEHRAVVTLDPLLFR